MRVRRQFQQARTFEQIKRALSGLEGLTFLRPDRAIVHGDGFVESHPFADAIPEDRQLARTSQPLDPIEQFQHR